MSKSFSDYRRGWKIKRNFKLINEETRKYINPWFLPAIYVLNVLVNLTGDINIPRTILWFCCFLLCFERFWLTVPPLKKVEPKKRILVLNVVLITGYLITLVIDVLTR
jgi:hypothetical protein